MDLKQLQYFLAVVEAGGFSAGATALQLAQSSLSRQIALLETELGQRLLVRTGRGATPTEAGLALLPHARQMLDIARRARDELQEMDDSPSGRITVGMPPRVALGLSAPLIQAFRQRLPRAVVSVSEALSIQLHEQLVAGRLDMALLFDPPSSPLLHYQTLMQEPLILVAPARGARLPERLSLGGLARYPLVLPSPPNAIRSLVDVALKARHVEVTVLAEVGAVKTVLTLVAQGVGCTIVPASSLALLDDPASVRHCPIGPPAILSRLVLATPKAGPHTRLRRETVQLLQALDFRSPAPLGAGAP